jgi:molybdate transport repressor ModE-like protein
MTFSYVLYQYSQDWKAVVNFAQLTAFQAVASHGSITGAAQRLRVSQPAISKHLKNLEENYGAKLFERNAGATELTDAGRILLRHVNAILVQLDEADRELKATQTVPKAEPLKVGGSFAASAMLLPSLLASFKNAHRDTPIILRTGTTRDVKSMVLSSAVEIGLINESPPNPNIASEPFRKERLVVFGAPSHALAKKKRLNLSDLNNATLVTTGRASTVDKVFKRLVREGLKARIAIHCGTPESVKTIVKKRIGLGIMFQDLIVPELRRKIFKTIEVPGLTLAVQSYIVYYRDRPLSITAREFLTLLRSKVHDGRS